MPDGLCKLDQVVPRALIPEKSDRSWSEYSTPIARLEGAQTGGGLEGFGHQQGADTMPVAVRCERTHRKILVRWRQRPERRTTDRARTKLGGFLGRISHANQRGPATAATLRIIRRSILFSSGRT